MKIKKHRVMIVTWRRGVEICNRCFRPVVAVFNSDRSKAYYRHKPLLRTRNTKKGSVRK